MLLQCIEKYYDKKTYDLNCAETILYAGNEAYKLGLDKKVLRIAAGFGGGMHIESVCGALTGAVMVLSLLFVKERGHESDRAKNLIREFFERYRKKMGDINCTPLKQKYKTEKNRCLDVIIEAGRILDDIVQREIGA